MSHVNGKKSHLQTHIMNVDKMNLLYRILIAFVVLFILLSNFFGVDYGFVQVKNGQNSTRIKSMEENCLRLNLDGKGTDSFLLQNYKPILNARKKKVKEVCQKYNLTSGTIPSFRNIYCTFQYKVRKL